MIIPRYFLDSALTHFMVEADFYQGFTQAESISIEKPWISEITQQLQ